MALKPDKHIQLKLNITVTCKTPLGVFLCCLIEVSAPVYESTEKYIEKLAFNLRAKLR